MIKMSCAFFPEFLKLMEDKSTLVRGQSLFKICAQSNYEFWIRVRRSGGSFNRIIIGIGDYVYTLKFAERSLHCNKATPTVASLSI